MSDKKIKYIAIEGVIGAGKTSLAKKLAAKLNAKLILEDFDDNPFLERFYNNPQRYAFHTQMYFLLSRYRQLAELRQPDLFHEYIVADYIFEKDKIFAYLNLQDDELKLYEKIATLIEKNIVIPDLIIYLQSSVDRLMFNIKHRDRDIEKEIKEDYIRDLNEGYNYFFFRFKSTRVLVVNSTEIDFVNNEKDFNELVEQIMKPGHSHMEYYDPAINKTN
ncbi:MAG TPA: deoxynucleoside kinase [Bacteroidetes bacterium]|mgnify:CR=1 FL=1|nr:deoxynucleoside kinase [Ignavibacteria bacterium]HCA41837.1 deoxynucleoside kinase [Bacteroidota bacterium]HCN37809.1 deoxynucleoside kinase [Bacteroidota bacterium]